MYLTTEEIEKELAEIEKHEFEIAMTDRWDDGDFRVSMRLHERKHELNEMLKERGNVQ